MTTRVEVTSRLDERGLGSLIFRPAAYTWSRASRGEVMAWSLRLPGSLGNDD